MSGSNDNNSIIVADLTDTPNSSIFFAIFDGHGRGKQLFFNHMNPAADLISKSAAYEFYKLLSEEEVRVIYPKNSRSILDGVKLNPSSENSTIIDDDYSEESLEDYDFSEAQKEKMDEEYKKFFTTERNSAFTEAQEEDFEEEYRKLFGSPKSPPKTTSPRNSTSSPKVARSDERY